MRLKVIVLLFGCTTALLAGPGQAGEGATELGRLLFFDPGLSEPPGQSCATCHAPDAAFADPDSRQATSKGVHPDRFGSRNAPSAMYMAFSPRFHFDRKEGHFVGGQFWDGRAATLEDQARGPFLNPLEMANPDRRSVVEKLRHRPYAARFDEVFGPGALASTEAAFRRMTEAIAAFERSPTFSPFNSRYDAWLAGQGGLSDQELRGLRLYEDERKGNCAACHPSRPGPRGEPPLFTDFTYDNLGVPRKPGNPFYALPKRFNPQGRAFTDRGLGAVVKRRAEDGKFKVPTLRNIARTAPYMHNGYFATLRGVVAFYNDRDVRPACPGEMTEADALARGCWPKPEVPRNVNRDELGRLGLTDQEVDDIVAFLRTLDDANP